MNMVLCCLPLVAAFLLSSVQAEGADYDIRCPLVGPTPPAACDGSDSVWFPVSVEGSKTFCALGPEVCVADIFAACPGPSAGLPYGSKCSQLKTDVYGCVPKTSCTDGDFDADTSDAACERGCSIDTSIPKKCDGSNGWTPVSVVNSSTFCTSGAVCVADAQNACPGPQPGLPFGSSCVKIPSGVFGCVRNQQCQTACSNTTILPTTAVPVTPAPTTPVPGTPASTTPLPMSPVPTTAPPTPAPTTLIPSTSAPTIVAPPSPAPTTALAAPTTTPEPTPTATPTTPTPQTTTVTPLTTPPTVDASADDLTATVAPDLVDSNTDLLPIPDPNAFTTGGDLPTSSL